MSKTTASSAKKALPESANAKPRAKKKAAKKASHDPLTPSALLDFMVENWEPRSAELPAPIANVEVFRARRNALSKMFPAETLIVPTGHEKVRANDTYYRFRPATEFYYLTGNVEPDCVLVMKPKKGGGHKHLLFVEPNPGKTDATFFTDRNKGELWVGPRKGVPESQAHYGVDECRPLAELPEMIESLRGKVTYPTRVTRGFDPIVDKRLRKNKRDKELATALSEMRLIKDDVEVVELEKAIASTHRGFDDVIARLKIAHSEREVEGVFNLRARVEGNDVGYGTIAACGAHACTLHWTKNDGEVKAGDLLLLDAGVEADTLYTADVTRTLPVSGKFTEAQRTIYELVLEAQRAAMAEVKPGADFLEPNRAAMKVLTRGLVDLGILKVTAEEALAEDKMLYRRYTLHNVSHMLGLDVHDCAKARQETYKFGKLKAGMVLTVEPGLYFQKDDLTVPEQYRGIGVRIEDDVLVTEDGVRNLSGDIPTGSDEVEAWMASVWAK